MTAPEQRTIYLQPAAPPKPAMGAACNGCGLCCLAEPCPLGIWVSRRRTGACKALQWDSAGQHYRCGMVSDPGAVLGWQQPWAVRLVARLARRWIAAGAGCDADWEAQKVQEAQETQEAPPRP